MEQTEEGAEIRSYTKSELAHMYNPCMCYVSSLRTLREWINRNEKLKKELADSGYLSSQHSFTPYQVKLIFTNLGIP